MDNWKKNLIMSKEMILSSTVMFLEIYQAAV